MEDPTNGQIAIKVGTKAYTLRGGTREMSQLEGLFKVIGFDEVFEKLEAAPVEELYKVADIFLRKHHEGLPEEERELILDILSVRGFRLHVLRLAAAAYGGQKGLEDFDRLRKLTAAAREAEMKKAEDEANPKRKAAA